jgi:hypothetical protein
MPKLILNRKDICGIKKGFSLTINEKGIYLALQTTCLNKVNILPILQVLICFPKLNDFPK